MKPLFLILNLLGVLVFAVFSWLQHEDNNSAIYENAGNLDMWSWILFYALISLGFVLAIVRKLPWALLGIAAAYCLFELVTTGPGLLANLTSDSGFDMTKSGMNPNAPQVEQSREFFGALIALGAVAFLAFQKRSQKV